jgi:hypothetical protein
MLVWSPTTPRLTPMSILEQARRDLQLARGDAIKAQATFKVAVARLREAEQRVHRLEIAQIETDALMHELQRRASAGR